MIKKARLICGFVIISLMLSAVTLCVSAAGDANVIIGTKLEFAEGSEPFIANERTMMPLRAISEALDATVYWFGEEQRVQIVCYDTLLSLQIGNTVMGKYKIVDGQVSEQPDPIPLEAPAMIQNDRTYVPLRAISEAFDAWITWDNPNRSAIIIPKDKETNDVSISEMKDLPDSTLCAAYGVIARDNETGLFYLRSLSKNYAGEYTQISFCTPRKTSISDDTEYGEYVSKYWLEQFGSENPSGMVVYFTGVTTVLDGENRAILNKTTTGIKPLGYYDAYMESLGMDYEPFDGLTA